MTLLICTQAVDSHDPVLGFFVRWIAKLAPHYERIEVVCLRAGAHNLPTNVYVHELPEGDRLVRARQFFSILQRIEYDAVFVHMNQEYVLLAGWLWRLQGKRIYLWRNHYAGSLFTRIAAQLCDKVLYTSCFSYTARYTNAVRMPVGVDTELFRPVLGVHRESRSILFLARMSRAKRPHMLVDALQGLSKKGVEYKAALYGSPPPEDVGYYEELKRKAEGLPIKFHSAVPHQDTPKIYSQHSIFVNCSPPGMYDKTLFEAAACGCVVVASSPDFAELVPRQFVFEENSVESLRPILESVLKLPEDELREVGRQMEAMVEEHSLKHLTERLVQEIRS